MLAKALEDSGSRGVAHVYVHSEGRIDALGRKKERNAYEASQVPPPPPRLKFRTHTSWHESACPVQEHPSVVHQANSRIDFSALLAQLAGRSAKEQPLGVFDKPAYNFFTHPFLYEEPPSFLLVFSAVKLQLDLRQICMFAGRNPRILLVLHPSFHTTCSEVF